MEKIKFLKQSSLVFLLSLSLLVGCNGNQNLPKGESPSPSPAGSSASPNTRGIDSDKEPFKGTKAEYDKLKEQAKKDWSNFKKAFDNFQKPYQNVIDPQLKNAIPTPKDPPSPNPSPATLPVGETIDLNTTFKPVRIAYNDFIKNNVTSTKLVLTEEVRQQIKEIGGEPLKENSTEQDKQKDEDNQTPLRQIERVLWGLKSGLELTSEQEQNQDQNQKKQIEDKRKEDIRKVQIIIGAEPVDKLYGKGTYDKIEPYLKKQFKAIKGDNDTKINGLETAIITDDTAFLPPPPEEPSPFPWRLLLIGGGTLVAVLLVAALTILQNRRQKLPSKRQLSDDDYAVLFAAMDHAFKQRNIEIDPEKVRQNLEVIGNPPSISKEEIINIVKNDLPPNLGANSLGSKIVTRVLQSNRLKQEISTENQRLKQEILEIIRGELAQGGYQQDEFAQGGYQGGGYERGTTHNRQQRVGYPSPATPQINQDSGISTQSSLPRSVEQYRNIYNDPQKQERGEVTKDFGKIATELEETQESYDRRAYQYSAPQHIELETVGKNQGSFWLIRIKENRTEGWLFPKPKIKSTYYKAVETLFEVEGALNSYNYIEIIKPAQMMTSDGGQIWKIGKKGRIQLLS